MEDLIYQVDSEGLVRWVSPSVKTLLGYAPEELIGQPATVLFASLRMVANHLTDEHRRRAIQRLAAMGLRAPEEAGAAPANQNVPPA